MSTLGQPEIPTELKSWSSLTCALNAWSVKSGKKSKMRKTCWADWRPSCLALNPAFSARTVALCKLNVVFVQNHFSRLLKHLWREKCLASTCLFETYQWFYSNFKTFFDEKDNIESYQRLRSSWECLLSFQNNFAHERLFFNRESVKDYNSISFLMPTFKLRRYC